MQRIENIEEIVIIDDIDVSTIGIRRKDEEDEIITIYKNLDPKAQEKIIAMKEFLRVFNLFSKIKFI